MGSAPRTVFTLLGKEMQVVDQIEMVTVVVQIFHPLNVELGPLN